MSTYDIRTTGDFYIDEQDMYGSGRLGAYNANIKVNDLVDHTTNNNYLCEIGKKDLEMTDHLGNVMVTLSDMRIAHNNGGTIDYYNASVTSATDYFPGGMPMPNRSYSPTEYKYGHNGQLKDDDIYGNGNAYTAQFWEYDPRLIRRWNRDPITKPWESPYGCFNENPIYFKDPSGLIGTNPPDDPPGFTESKTGTTQNPIKLRGCEVFEKKPIWLKKASKQVQELVREIGLYVSKHKDLIPKFLAMLNKLKGGNQENSNNNKITTPNNNNNTVLPSTFTNYSVNATPPDQTHDIVIGHHKEDINDYIEAVDNADFYVSLANDASGGKLDALNYVTSFAKPSKDAVTTVVKNNDISLAIFNCAFFALEYSGGTPLAVAKKVATSPYTLNRIGQDARDNYIKATNAINAGYDNSYTRQVQTESLNMMKNMKKYLEDSDSK